MLHMKVLLHLHVTSLHVLLWEPRFSSLVALVLWKILRQTLLSQIKHSLDGLMISSVLTQVHYTPALTLQCREDSHHINSLHKL